MLTDRAQRVPLHQRDSQRRQSGIDRAVMTVLQAFDGLTPVHPTNCHDCFSKQSYNVLLKQPCAFLPLANL